MDRQVKVRGFRIELGEVENAMLQCVGVKTAAVVLRKEVAARSELAALVGFVTPVSLQPAVVGAHCRTVIPSYMVPSMIVSLEELPSLPNGKTNLRALQEQAQERALVIDSLSVDVSALLNKKGHDAQDAAALAEAGVDSMGTVRLFSKVRRCGVLEGHRSESVGLRMRPLATQAFARELVVADNLRAMAMLGVVIFHWKHNGLGGPHDSPAWDLHPRWANHHAVPFWSVPYSMVLRLVVNTALCNYVFIYLIAYYEASHEEAKRLTTRDFVTLLLIVECAFIFRPIATYFRLELPATLAGEPEHGPSAVDHFGKRWFLITILYAKLYVVGMSRLRAPPLLQLFILLCAMLVFTGDALWTCAPYNEVSLNSFIAQLYPSSLHYIYVAADGTPPHGIDANGPRNTYYRCASMLSFEGGYGVIQVPQALMQRAGAAHSIDM
eukprot:2247786-Prymnesium_polylepis.2